MPFDFDGMHLEIRIKKYGIFNPPVLASAMIRVFPSLEHSGGACPHSARQFVGLLCVPLMAPLSIT